MASGFGMSFGDFRPNSAGIVEVFTSGGMQAALADVARGLAERANSTAHLSHARNMPVYLGGVDVLDRTAVGTVRTGNVEAAIDQGVHHTLDSLNH